MIQNILVGLLFLVALIYLAIRLFRQFKTSLKSSGGSCGADCKCGFEPSEMTEATSAQAAELPRTVIKPLN